jgi:hypothetical protein
MDSQWLFSFSCNNNPSDGFSRGVAGLLISQASGCYVWEEKERRPGAVLEAMTVVVLFRFYRVETSSVVPLSSWGSILSEWGKVSGYKQWDLLSVASLTRVLQWLLCTFTMKYFATFFGLMKFQAALPCSLCVLL